MADWCDTAKLALSILDGDTSDAGVLTINVVNHVLDENNRDDYREGRQKEVYRRCGADGVTSRVGHHRAHVNGIAAERGSPLLQDLSAFQQSARASDGGKT
jgi:hypothetical protein